MPNHITNKIKITGPNAHGVLLNFLNKQGFFDFNKVIPVPKELDIPSSNFVEGLAASLRGEREYWFRDDIPDGDAAIAYWQKRMGNEFKKNLTYAKQYNSNLEKYGVGTWYQANRKVWGTKWNAYDQSFPVPHPKSRFKGPQVETWSGKKIRKSETSYRKRVLKKHQKRHQITECQFDTAWSTPTGVWSAMVGHLPPGVVVSVEFADEDTGSNCGTFSFNNAGIISKDIAPAWSDMNTEQKRYWTKFAFGISHPDTDPRAYGYNENWEYDETIAEDYEATES